MRKEYDFSNARPNPYAKRLKRPVTIRLDERTIGYFQGLAAELDVPYQTLINLYLRDCAESGRRPAMHWRPRRKTVPPLVPIALPLPVPRAPWLLAGRSGGDPLKLTILIAVIAAVVPAARMTGRSISIRVLAGALGLRPSAPKQFAPALQRLHADARGERRPKGDQPDGAQADRRDEIAACGDPVQTHGERETGRDRDDEPRAGVSNGSTGPCVGTQGGWVSTLAPCAAPFGPALVQLHGGFRFAHRRTGCAGDVREQSANCPQDPRKTASEQGKTTWSRPARAKG